MDTSQALTPRTPPLLFYPYPVIAPDLGLLYGAAAAPRLDHIQQFLGAFPPPKSLSPPSSSTSLSSILHAGAHSDPFSFSLKTTDCFLAATPPPNDMPGEKATSPNVVEPHILLDHHRQQREEASSPSTGNSPGWMETPAVVLEDEVLGVILKRRGLADAAKLLMTEMDCARQGMNPRHVAQPQPSAIQGKPTSSSSLRQKRPRDQDSPLTSKTPCHLPEENLLGKRKGLASMASSLLQQMDKELTSTVKTTSPTNRRPHEDDSSRRKILLQTAEALLMELEDGNKKQAAASGLSKDKGSKKIKSQHSMRHVMPGLGCRSPQEHPKRAVSEHRAGAMKPKGTEAEKKWPVVFGVELVPVSVSV